MTRDQAIINSRVLYTPWARQRRPDRYGVIASRPDANNKVHVILGHTTYEVLLQDLQLSPHPLVDDLDLIDAMKNEMKFVDDPHLRPHNRHSVQQQLEADQRKLELIRYFEETYGNTDQDTVFYGPELAIVVRNILAGKRPVKLRFLTDFEGEEK